jgi:hypothetical protein
MFISFSFAARAAVILGLCIQTARAQFNPCSGGCHIVQVPVNAACGVDPNDGSTFAYAFGVCPCVNGETYTLAVTYTGVDGIGA